MLKKDQMTTYKGHDYKVVDVEDISQPGTCGEPEYLYHLLNRHGEIIILTCYEFSQGNKYHNQ